MKSSRDEKRKKRLSIGPTSGLSIKLPSININDTVSTPTTSSSNTIAIEGTRHLMNLIELVSSEVDLLRIALEKEKEEKELLKEWIEDLFKSKFINLPEETTLSNSNASDHNLSNNNNNDSNSQTPYDIRNFDTWLADRTERLKRIETEKTLRKTSSPMQKGKILSSLSLTSTSTFRALQSPHIPPPPVVGDGLRLSSSKVDLSVVSQIPIPPPIVNDFEKLNNENNEVILHEPVYVSCNSVILLLPLSKSTFFFCGNRKYSPLNIWKNHDNNNANHRRKRGF
jgi:hypothetical protein